MSEPSTAVPSSTSEATSSCPQRNEYDNFYTPRNEDFYSSIGYMSFKPEDRKIRLLRIHPLKPGEDEQSPIEAELVDNQPLDAVRGDFTTVSYFAGNPKKTEAILINGRSFNAFSNLGHALRMIRHFWKEKFGTRELLLWADQVCINQSDLHERSHQVDFMGDIYGSAMQVLVCLSVDGDSNRSGGFRWLSQFSSEFKKCLQSQIEPECTNDTYDIEYHRFRFLLEHFEEKSFHCGWNTFCATVRKSPWWRRAWIRQEFLRSPDAYFLFGNEYIHWEAAAEAINLYYVSSLDYYGRVLREDKPCPISSRTSSDACQICLCTTDDENPIFAGKRVYRLVSAKLENSKKKDASDLLDWLKEMRFCEASDPRDLIYAGFGISAHSYNLYPNYASDFSFQDLLVQVARHFISHRQSLNVMLRYAGLTRRSSHGSDLPSWVPDWRDCMVTCGGLQNILRRPRSTDYFAFHPDSRGRPGRILQVRGVHVKDTDRTLFHIKERFKYAGRIIPSGESYMLHGASNIFILHRRDQYFKVVGEIPDPDDVYLEVELLMDDLEQMVERNDPAVKIIKIC